MSGFRTDSVNLTREIPLSQRKSQGIFFTPANLRNYIWDYISKIPDYTPTTILEPSFGSGEFMYDAQARYPAVPLTGLELNTILYTDFDSKNTSTHYKLYNQDFLDFPYDKQYNCIIGNPPYFIMKKPFTTNVNQLYNESSIGKCNIFVLFLYKCLKYHLEENGILAFVIPAPFYNSSNYNPCRKYIYDNCTILNVMNMKANFIDTKQDVFIIVIQNKKSSSHPYFIKIKDSYLITPDYKQANDILSRNTYTHIQDLGCIVKTGNIVWNQVKSSLTDTPADGHIPLVYSHNIKDKRVDLDFEPTLAPGKVKVKMKYVIKSVVGKDETERRTIVVARGYGNSFTFKYGFAPAGIYAENHVNIISGTGVNLLKIFKSFGKPETETFIKAVFRNGALSKTELEQLVPIFV